MSDFSYTLRKIRTEKGFLQKDIANAIGVSVQAYSLYERGMREPTVETIKKIADVLDVTADELLGIENTPTTIAAHFDGDEYTEDELEEIRQFAEFIKSKRKDSVPEVNAAHARTDIEITEEMRKHDNDIMNDENF